MLWSLSLRLSWPVHQPSPPRNAVSPLCLPEILVQIFSHLSNETLRFSVAPVCRLWLRTIQNTLVREVVWYSNWEMDKKARILDKLPGAERFICICPSVFYQTERMLLDAFRRIENEYQRQIASIDSSSHNTQSQSKDQALDQVGDPLQRKQDRFICYRHVPLRHMEFFIKELESRTFDSFPFPSSLTTLQLTFNRGEIDRFSLTRIMTICPLLVTFHAWIKSNRTISIDFKEPSKEIDLVNAKRPPLLLQSLILQGFYMDLSEFRDFLTRIQHLKELKLISIQFHGDFSWLPVLATIQALSLKLESAHFSFSNRANSCYDLQKLLSLRPPTSEWSLWEPDVQVDLLKSLESASTFNTITTLELYWNIRSYSWNADCHGSDMTKTSDLIHHYLCNSPHLMHLQTIKSRFLMRNMDLFGRRYFRDLDHSRSKKKDDEIFGFDYSDPKAITLPTSNNTSGIWKCRNLKTLCIEISAHSDSVPLKYGVQSRILFGYISRVCPHLKDLHISWPSVCVYGKGNVSHIPRLSLQLDGGLCLLARLRSLRRLKIEEYYLCQGPGCEIFELNWIVPSGRDAWSRRKRSGVMSQWRSKEAEESRLEKMRKKAGGLKDLTIKSASQDELAVAKSLQSLGLLSDTVDMIKEIDSNRYVGLRELTKISFEYPLDNRPWHELYRLFPKSCKLLEDNTLQWI